MFSNIKAMNTSSEKIVKSKSVICAAKTCFNSSLCQPNLSFFRFPSDDKIAKIWASNADREDITLKIKCEVDDYFLCAEHFDDSCFDNHNLRNKLKNLDSVPTIFKDNFINTRTKVFNKKLYTNRNDPKIKIVPNNNTNEIIKENSSPHVASSGESINNSDVNQFIKKRKRDEYCRLCAKLFSSDTLISLTNGEGIQYGIILTKYLSNKFPENDNLPRVICKDCKCKLISCSTTLESFEDAHDRLSKYFKCSLPQNNENLVQTKRTKFNLNDRTQNLQPELQSDEEYVPPLPQTNFEQSSMEINPIIVKANCNNETTANPLPDTIIATQLLKTSNENDTDIKYQCSLCNILLNDKQNAVDHSLEYHPEEKDKLICRIVRVVKVKEKTKPKIKFQCILCNTLLDSRKIFISHTLTVHPEKKDKIDCRVVRVTQCKIAVDYDKNNSTCQSSLVDSITKKIENNDIILSSNNVINSDLNKNITITQNVNIQNDITNEINESLNTRENVNVTYKTKLDKDLLNVTDDVLNSLSLDLKDNLCNNESQLNVPSNNVLNQFVANSNLSNYIEEISTSNATEQNKIDSNLLQIKEKQFIDEIISENNFIKENFNDCNFADSGVEHSNDSITNKIFTISNEDQYDNKLNFKNIISNDQITWGNQGNYEIQIKDINDECVENYIDNIENSNIEIKNDISMRLEQNQIKFNENYNVNKKQCKPEMNLSLIPLENEKDECDQLSQNDLFYFDPNDNCPTEEIETEIIYENFDKINLFDNTTELFNTDVTNSCAGFNEDYNLETILDVENNQSDNFLTDNNKNNDINNLFTIPNNTNETESFFPMNTNGVYINYNNPNNLSVHLKDKPGNIILDGNGQMRVKSCSNDSPENINFNIKTSLPLNHSKSNQSIDNLLQINKENATNSNLNKSKNNVFNVKNANIDTENILNNCRVNKKKNYSPRKKSQTSVNNSISNLNTKTNISHLNKTNYSPVNNNINIKMGNSIISDKLRTLVKCTECNTQLEEINIMDHVNKAHHGSKITKFKIISFPNKNSDQSENEPNKINSEYKNSNTTTKNNKNSETAEFIKLPISNNGNLINICKSNDQNILESVNKIEVFPFPLSEDSVVRSQVINNNLTNKISSDNQNKIKSPQKLKTVVLKKCDKQVIAKLFEKSDKNFPKNITILTNGTNANLKNDNFKILKKTTPPKQYQNRNMKKNINNTNVLIDTNNVKTDLLNDTRNIKIKYEVKSPSIQFLTNRTTNYGIQNNKIRDNVPVNKRNYQILNKNLNEIDDFENLITSYTVTSDKLINKSMVETFKKVEEVIPDKLKCINEEVQLVDEDNIIDTSDSESESELDDEQFEKLINSKDSNTDSIKVTYKCSVCDLLLSKKCLLLCHMRVKHFKNNKKIMSRFRYECLECYVIYTTEEEYTKHVLSGHYPLKNNEIICRIIIITNYEQTLIKCLLCSKICIGGYSNYKNHLKEHSHIIKKSLLNQSVIKDEVLCDICGLSYLYKEYKYHLLSHSTKQQYICHVCFKIFSSAVVLRHHLHSHDIQNSYYCKYCLKKFRKLFTFYHHMALHKRAPMVRAHLTCKTCRKVFQSKWLLERHKKLNHDLFLL